MRVDADAARNRQRLICNVQWRTLHEQALRRLSATAHQDTATVINEVTEGATLATIFA
jgi:hypothetical protein